MASSFCVGQRRARPPGSGSDGNEASLFPERTWEGNSSTADSSHCRSQGRGEKGSAVTKLHPKIQAPGISACSRRRGPERPVGVRC